jgi:hypothetical protein
VNGLVDLVFSHLQTLHSDPTLQQLSNGATFGDDSITSPIDLNAEYGIPQSNPTTAGIPQVSPLQRTETHFRDTLRHVVNEKNKLAMEGDQVERQRWEEIVVEEVLHTVESWSSN